MSRDPLIDEVRQARHEISQECDHDLRKLYARYDAMEKQMKAEGKWRFVSQPLVGPEGERSDEGRTGH
jgi:hypothetical protein